MPMGSSGRFDWTHSLTECFIVVSLTDDGGKWAPGTMLHAFPLGHRFEAGDGASFHIERVQSRKYTLADLKAMRCKKVLNLKELMNDAKIADKVVQKNNIHWTLCDRVISVTFGEITIKPDLNKLTDFDSLTLKDCDPKYLPKIIDVYSEEDLERIEGGK